MLDFAKFIRSDLRLLRYWSTGDADSVSSRTRIGRHGNAPPMAEVLELYGEFEAQAETGGVRSYREVLNCVVRSFGNTVVSRPPWQKRPRSQLLSRIGGLADTVRALKRLGARIAWRSSRHR